MKPATTTTAVLLVIISAAHLVRLLLGVPVTVGGASVPTWVSIIGTVVPAALAFGLQREHRPGLARVQRRCRRWRRRRRLPHFRRPRCFLG